MSAVKRTLPGRVTLRQVASTGHDRALVALLVHLLRLLQALASDRARIALENVALRQQIVVLKRTTKRARITDSDRAFWLLMKRMLKDWQSALLIVKPETVLRWHRQGFRAYWRRKSKGPLGRPPIDRALICLIKRMSKDNPIWGAPRIQKELALLGHELSETTVAKYMVKHRSPPGTWRAFIARHMHETAACDFFVVPTVTFKQLYCFVVLSLDRRRILHINVTRHPTAEWAGQQLLEAFPGTEGAPRLLIRDRDSIYGDAFTRAAKTVGVEQLVTGHRMPRMNSHCERVIGTIRRECTDHIIALGERHLSRVLSEYVRHYNLTRPRGSLSGNSPVARVVETRGDIISTPVLGGLHHEDRPAAGSYCVSDDRVRQGGLQTSGFAGGSSRLQWACSGGDRGGWGFWDPQEWPRIDRGLYTWS